MASRQENARNTMEYPVTAKFTEIQYQSFVLGPLLAMDRMLALA